MFPYNILTLPLTAALTPDWYILENNHSIDFRNTIKHYKERELNRKVLKRERESVMHCCPLCDAFAFNSNVVSAESLKGCRDLRKQITLAELGQTVCLTLGFHGSCWAPVLEGLMCVPSLALREWSSGNRME